MRKIPIVFLLVANPFIAGAGKTDADHLPNVTGAYACAPHREAVRIVKRLFPQARRLGTLFVPAEVNSVFYKDDLQAACREAGLELETIGVSSIGEIPDAAMALCGRNIDVFSQLTDNLTSSSFASILQVAKRARMPLVGFASGHTRNGAVMTLSRDYYDNGADAATLAARILQGESPARIPFKKGTTIRLSLNPSAAESFGVKLPEDLLREANEVIRPGAGN